MARKPQLSPSQIDTLADALASKVAERLIALRSDDATEQAIVFLEDAAMMFKCHRSTVLRMVKVGHLPEPGLFGGRRGWLQSIWNAALRARAADNVSKLKRGKQAEAALDALAANVGEPVEAAEAAA